MFRHMTPPGIAPEFQAAWFNGSAALVFSGHQDRESFIGRPDSRTGEKEAVT
jgi:hypothetical protein